MTARVDSTPASPLGQQQQPYGEGRTKHRHGVCGAAVISSVISSIQWTRQVLSLCTFLKNIKTSAVQKVTLRVVSLLFLKTFFFPKSLSMNWISQTGNRCRLFLFLSLKYRVWGAWGKQCHPFGITLACCSRSERSCEVTLSESLVYELWCTRINQSLLLKNYEISIKFQLTAKISMPHGMCPKKVCQIRT